MGMFDYTALTAEGKLMMGRLEAAGLDEAADRLSGMGLTVQSLQKSAARAPARIGRDEFLMFNQQTRLGSRAAACRWSVVSASLPPRSSRVP